MTTARIAWEPDTRRSLIEVAHAANGVTQPVPLYVASRIGSPFRTRADWWVLEQEGEVVAGLLSYPLTLTSSGRPTRGYGFGSVVTHPAHQRLGHASRLLRHVIDHEEARGRPLGVLFSAIPPGLYERLGFVVAPAFDHICEDPASLASSGAQAMLVPIDPRDELARILRAWDAAPPSLGVARDGSAWGTSIELFPRNQWFAAGDGYVRLVVDGRELEVVEVLGTDPAPALRACAQLAAERGVWLSTWHPPVPELDPYWSPRSRAETLLMVRGDADLSTPQLWSSDYF